MDTYENMRLVLEAVKYEDHWWQICGDFNVVAVLLSMQLGCTKYCIVFSTSEIVMLQNENMA